MVVPWTDDLPAMPAMAGATFTSSIHATYNAPPTRPAPKPYVVPSSMRPCHPGLRRGGRGGGGRTPSSIDDVVVGVVAVVVVVVGVSPCDAKVVNPPKREEAPPLFDALPDGLAPSLLLIVRDACVVFVAHFSATRGLRDDDACDDECGG